MLWGSKILQSFCFEEGNSFCRVYRLRASSVSCVIPCVSCVQVEGQQCINIPVQQCSNVPVTAPVEVPQERCYKRPRRVCQTLVSTKPRVITAQVPREVCGHSAPSAGAPVRSTSSGVKNMGSSISRSYTPARRQEQEGGYYDRRREEGGYYDRSREDGGYQGGEKEKRNWNKEQNDHF